MPGSKRKSAKAPTVAPSPLAPLDAPEPRSRPDPWTPAAISALGYQSDAAIARSIGVTREAVRQKRERMGIPAGNTGPVPKPRDEVTRSSSIRLTPADEEAFERAAGGRGWRAWLIDLGRKAAGIES